MNPHRFIYVLACIGAFSAPIIAFTAITPPTDPVITTSTSTACPYREQLITAMLVSDSAKVMPAPTTLTRAQVRLTLARQIDDAWVAWDNAGRPGSFIQSLAALHMPEGRSRDLWVATVRDILKRQGVDA